ncbi:MAG: phosphatase PAP2 family protein [Bacilli bacterium]|nr:phosphatase PAP2 family protein [Bacilli bacterium]
MKKIRKEYYFIAVLLILFFVLTLLVASNKTIKLDESVFNKLILIKNKPTTESLRVITHLASTIGIIVIGGIIGAVFLVRKKLSDFKYVVINVVLGAGSMYVIKHFIKRVRPSWKWIVQDGFSYPSGHTICAMLLYGTLILLVAKRIKGKKKNILIALLSLMIVLTGVSRIYFGAHYLTDVVASVILGSIILIVSNMFMNKEFNIGKDKTKKAIQTK